MRPRKHERQGVIGTLGGNIRVLVRSKARRNLLLYYTDPATGREVSRSAKTRDRAEAERAAARWEQELLAYRGPAGDGWKLFVDRFRAEHLPTLSPASEAIYSTALTTYQRLMEPQRIADVTAAALSQFQMKLMAEGKRTASIATYLAHLRAALNWAEAMGIAEAPAVRLPRQVRRTFMRGRPITEAEYRRMLAESPPDLKRLIDLIWFSGLRLGEALKLSWSDPPIKVELDAKPYPLIRFHGEGHKARRDAVVPLAPDCAAWLRRTLPAKRSGLVAPIAYQHPARASSAITDVGRAARVFVDDEGKPASAHDLRRAFGTRWAQRVMPAVLRVLMRHADISTTLRYYVDISTSDVGRALWGESAKTPKQRRMQGSAAARSE